MSTSPSTLIGADGASVSAREQARNPNDDICGEENESISKQFDDANSICSSLTSTAALQQHHEHEDVSDDNSDNESGMAEEDTQNDDWQQDEESTTDDDIEPSKRQRRSHQAVSPSSNSAPAWFLARFRGQYQLANQRSSEAGSIWLKCVFHN